MFQDFIVLMKNRMGVGEPERNATDCFERGQRIVPDSIKNNEDEIPVKQYNIAILQTILLFKRAEARMQVTNKRLIFRAAGRSIGGRTTLQHEYAINEIAGIEARREYKFRFLYFIGGILLLLLTSYIGVFLTSFGYGGLSIVLYLLFFTSAMIAFFTIPKEFALKLALLGVSLGSFNAVIGGFLPSLYTDLLIGMYNPGFAGGGHFAALITVIIFVLYLLTIIVTFFCMFFHFMRPNLVISIKNKVGIGEGPVDIRCRTTKSEGTGFYEVIPTEETDGAIREIGAMIGDIQLLGDLGLEKWMKK